MSRTGVARMIERLAVWIERLVGAAASGAPKHADRSIGLGSLTGSELLSADNTTAMRLHTITLCLAFFLPAIGLAQFGAGTTIVEEVFDLNAIRSADLDGDQDMDLVVRLSGAIAWVENLDGLGTFGALDTIYAMPGSGPMDLADMDDDGDVDLVAADVPGSAVYRFANDGDGGFTPPQLIASTSAWPPVQSLLCHQLTGDDLPEVLIGTGGYARWFINTGGDFPTQDSLFHVSGPMGRTLLAGDLDMDTDIDQLIINGFGATSAGLNEDGNGTVWVQQGLSLPFSVASAAFFLLDVEGDGDPDLVDVRNLVRWAQNLRVEEGAWGNFQIHDIAAGQGFMESAGWAGELGCGAGVSLIWCSSPFDGPVEWCKYDHMISAFTPPQPIADLPSARRLHAADLNGDAKPDLILWQVDSAMAWYPNTLEAPGAELTLTPFDTLCATATAYPLDHALPAGGIWTGEGVDANSFTPPGAGSFAMAYVVYDPVGACPLSSVQSIEVISSPQIVSASDLGDPCVTGLIQCIGIPAGGAWGGAADASGVIDTDALRPFAGGLTYEFTDATGSTCSQDIPYQLRAFVPLGIGPHGPYCSSDTAQVFQVTGPPNGGFFVTGADMSAVQMNEFVIVVTFDPGIGAGDYPFTVSGSAPMMCAITIMDTIHVNAIPDVTLELFMDMICDSSAAEALDDEGLPLGGLYDIDGSAWNDTVLDPAQWAPGPHTLTYTYTDEVTGCSTTDTTTFTITICTGLAGVASDPASLTLFPNPVESGPVRISCPPGADLRIYDAAGRTVWEARRLSSIHLLDVGGFDPGCYAVCAGTNGRTLHQRLVIQR